MVIRELFSKTQIDKTDKEVLLAAALNTDRAALLLCRDINISQSQENEFLRFSRLREKGCPVAYILGEKEFYSLKFKVTRDTLIPRPDTETLVDWAIPRAEGARILDLCCGSGCIAVAIAKNSRPKSVDLTDISESALNIAKENCEFHHVDANIYSSDILRDSIPSEYDLIVSNPPYIESDVIPTLDTDVAEYEPVLALDGGKNGLLFYPAIIEKAALSLSKNGSLGVEIGYNQGRSVTEIMKRHFEEVVLIYDLAQNPRVVTGTGPIR